MNEARDGVFRSVIAVEVSMWKKWVAVLCLVAFLGAGCSTMGEVTGKTVKGVKNAAGDFKDGYRKGRGE